MYASLHTVKDNLKVDFLYSDINNDCVSNEIPKENLTQKLQSL